MRLRCPHCGDRVHAEFAYRGDAAPVRPVVHDGRAEPVQFHDYVYLRDNPAGLLREYWQHVGGCRAWLVVERDVTSHAVADVAFAGAQSERRSAGR